MLLFLLIPILIGMYYASTENFESIREYSRIECPTRNMSYDLRGEAFFPDRINFPFDNSVIGSSNERCYPKKINLEIM